MRLHVDDNIDKMQGMVCKVEHKLTRVEDTDVVMGRVLELVSQERERIDQNIELLTNKHDDAFTKLYQEELSCEGLEFNTLKDFVLNCADINTKQDSRIDKIELLGLTTKKQVSTLQFHKDNQLKE